MNDEPVFTGKTQGELIEYRMRHGRFPKWEPIPVGWEQLAASMGYDMSNVAPGPYGIDEGGHKKEDG